MERRGTTLPLATLELENFTDVLTQVSLSLTLYRKTVYVKTKLNITEHNTRLSSFWFSKVYRVVIKEVNIFVGQTLLYRRTLGLSNPGYVLEDIRVYETSVQI